jgi:glycosyltransferase involved in cell wall biosynthesis
MRYPGVETIAYPRAGRGRVRALLRWLHAGRDDSLAIMARYGASGRLPGELTRFIERTRVELVHVNHAFSIPLAERVAHLVQCVQGRRPRLLLDTHDVQSDAIVVRQKKNPHSHRLDSHADLLRSELGFCAQADAIVHLTQADCDFFAARLPGKHHSVILPTLDPTSEAKLVASRGRFDTGGASGGRPPSSSLIYIGTQHEANLATVRWLLGEVLPLAGPSVTGRVHIIGAVGGLVRRRDPELFQRYATLFAGEVPSVIDLLTAARAVLAPATAGTGTSIKLIEALCAGKPVLATTLGLRGVPAGALTGADIEVHDTAADFAAALTRWCETAGPGYSEANAALYDRVFSNERYFAALDRLIVNGRRHGREAGQAGARALAR